MHRRLKESLLLLAALAVVAVPFACGGEDTGMDPDPEPVDTVTVTMTSDLTFEPDSVAISPGDVIEWVDEVDEIGHTVTPDGHSEWTSQGIPDGADPFYHEFESAGTFDYYCIPHQPDMTGTVTVE